MAVCSPPSGPLDQQPKSSMDEKRGCYRRCNSAPSLDMSSEPTDVGGLLPGTKSIYRMAAFFAIYPALGVPSYFLMLKGPKINEYVDTFYFYVVTMTTVGYGDLVPDNTTTKLLSCGFTFTGMAIIALFLSNFADYLIEKKLVLLMKALRHCYKGGEAQMVGEIYTKRLRNKLIVAAVSILVLMLGGTIFLKTVERLDWVDAVYCVCSTVTTLGYGDQSFTTGWGRLVSGFWMLMSTVYLAQFFAYLAEMRAEHRRQAMAKSVLNRRMTLVDLNAADLDNDGAVGAAEFIIYKLKEMKKIKQEDIAVVMEEFERLNVNHSGKLSYSDVVHARSASGGASRNLDVDNSSAMPRLVMEFEDLDVDHSGTLSDSDAVHARSASGGASRNLDVDNSSAINAKPCDAV